MTRGEQLLPEPARDFHAALDLETGRGSGRKGLRRPQEACGNKIHKTLEADPETDYLLRGDTRSLSQRRRSGRRRRGGKKIHAARLAHAVDGKAQRQ